MSKLTLVRGLPGSGKSTHADSLRLQSQHAPWVTVRSTDDYFTRPDGHYDFNHRVLGKAHEWNQRVTRELLDAGYHVIVANTFSQQWEMEPYLSMTGPEDTPVEHEIIDLFDAGLTDQELAARNVHGVPVETIAKMRARWEQT